MPNLLGPSSSVGGKVGIGITPGVFVAVGVGEGTVGVGDGVLVGNVAIGVGVLVSKGVTSASTKKCPSESESGSGVQVGGRFVGHRSSPAG